MPAMQHTQHLLVGGPGDGMVVKVPDARAMVDAPGGFYLRTHLSPNAIVYDFHTYRPSRWARKSRERVDFSPKRGAESAQVDRKSADRG